jgi:hypothetical protein
MKMCSKHWQELRDAIIDRGLEKLISNSAESLFDSTIKSIQGEASIDDYDPLMTAYFEICSQALSILGVGLLLEETTCPICTPLQIVVDHLDNCKCVEEYHAKDNLGYVQRWITLAANAQLEYAREHKLVPPLQ